MLSCVDLWLTGCLDVWMCEHAICASLTAALPWKTTISRVQMVFWERILPSAHTDINVRVDLLQSAPN